MAEAVFPFVVYPAEGQLPFINTCTVKQGNTLLALHVPISVWPAPGGQTPVGVTYDHQGETALEFKDIFRTPNARAVIDDQLYTVVDLQTNLYLPHVALLLRESQPMI